MPDVVIGNDTLASLIGNSDKGAAWAKAKLGIVERRFMTPLDSRGVPTADADELDMAAAAARDAIINAGMEPSDVGGLWYISCTQKGSQRQHFSTSAFELHRRLELPTTAIPLEMDAGCGGAVHALALGTHMLGGNCCDNILVVAANGPSRYYAQWEPYVASDVWLSMYIFGDGAGAAVLRRTDSSASQSHVIGSYLGVNPNQPLMYYEPRGNNPTPLYVIDGRAVAAGFSIYAKRALGGLTKQCDLSLDDVTRFYFHQVNGNVLMQFVEKMGLPPEKVALHVDHYGNIAAAATLVLLDEDRKAGIVGDGDLCVLCTVGAGAQYGALLVRL